MRRMLFVLIAFLLVAPAGALAQLTTGTISGIVKDDSGAVLPGVTVTLRHVDTGVSRMLVTDAEGRYEAPSLPLGAWEVRAELSGFRPMVRSGIGLTVGRRAIVDLVLAIGALEEVVTVVGEAALLETKSATVSNLVDSQRVEQLPLNNRDLTQLTYLQLGVVKMPRTSGGTFSGMGDTISVAGARGNQNLYLLDGVASSDISGNPQGAMGAYVGAETVQEFQIITNNYSAEYRSQPGGIISAVTKSGSNALHGSAFWTLRNDALDSPNYFDERLGVEKPKLSRHQYGGSVGGPIVRDRTFFFASFEGLRERLGLTTALVVPSMAARQGILPTGVVPVSPAVRPYLDLWPVPGDGNTVVQDLGGGTVQIAGIENRPTDGHYVLGKIDHDFGRAGRLAVTYNYDAADSQIVGLRARVGAATSTAGDGLGSASTKHVASVKHTSIWSQSIVNELSFGYNRTLPEGAIPVNPLDFGSLVFLPQRDLMGELSVSGVDQVGFRFNLEAYGQNIFTIQNGLSWNRGNHSLRIGAEVNPMRLMQDTSTRGVNGIYTFDSLEKFLQGQPTQFDAVLPTAYNPVRYLSQFLFGAYLQDNWTVRSDLTLNLGLRYEFMTVPKERDGNTGSLLHYTDTEVTVGPLFKNPTLKSFSPRLGFAWAPGERKTSVRGGFGIYYEHPSLYQARTTLQELPPFVQVGTLRQRDIGVVPLRFPDAYSTQLDLIRQTVSVRSMEYDLDTMRGYRWSLMAQRELPAQFVLSVGYTGSIYRHLLVQTIASLNRWEGYPAQPEGPKFFPVGVQKINPAWADMRLQSTKGNADYHGLAVGVQKRLSQGLAAQLSYSYAKSMDEASGVTSTGDNFSQGQRTVQGYWDIYLDRGLSSFDVRNNLAANFTYELPFGRNLTGLAGGLGKGWRVNGILMLSDGFPLSVSGATRAAIDRIGNGDGLRADLVPGGNNNPVQGGVEQYFDPTQFAPTTPGYFGTAGRNTLITPGLATFDLGLSKAFSMFGNGRVLQFRAEIFNLFNRPNFGTPDTRIITANGSPNPTVGQINNTRTTARQIQLGLRFVF